jgi:hypothetical protein
MGGERSCETFAEDHLMDNSRDPETPTPRPMQVPVSTPREGYCLRCQTRLEPTRGNCARCLSPFDWNDPATYYNKPRFLALRFWFPGFCLAVASGVISYAIVMQTGEMGFALFVSVPMSFGAILGYSTRTSTFVMVALGLVAAFSVVMAIISLNLAGFFCGATLGIVFVLPMMVGILFGFILRSVLKGWLWDQRRFLPLVFFVLLPHACEFAENRMHGEHLVATVETGLTIDATPAEAWQALMFYEDVKHAPPWLLKLALPKPTRSEGRKSQVGDIVRCIYDRGRLCKEVTEVVPDRKLAFNVVEQKLHFEHDVLLRSGSFEFVPVGPRKTRVVLTTRYERLCWPEWFWGPIERNVIHTLHEHVIEGIRLEVERERGDSPETKPPAINPAPVAGDFPLRSPVFAGVRK